MSQHNCNKHEHEKGSLGSEEKIIAATRFSESFHKWANLPEDAIVMDFGCGTGIAGQYFLDKVAKVIFLDPEKKGLDTCREHFGSNPKAELILGEIDSYNGEKIDAIEVSLTLHHIEDVEGTIDKFLKVLKPHGKVGVVEFTPDIPFFARVKPKIPHYGFEPEKLKAMFLAHGYPRVEIHPADPISFLQDDGTNEVNERFALYAEAP
ncbi:class I SAM-dependent methyltransferase [Histomonas meleagridis]|uniref:class I SAM-dependent methyltransferase n=1 Tax=Histomonas meleagridis TaxID=135588 RepID=UPI00355A2558|nr:class I SAM-dependent methyltransferase [Histomonas meleagridis]KAH0803641.1 class I SAM-dependent methyltransferase [Histomonas meleagridis]